MRHAMRYEGGYEKNFSTPRPNADQYIGEDDMAHPCVPWPSSADGLRYGFMEQRGKRFFAVRVCYGDRAVTLQHPVRIDPALHTGGKRFTSEPMRVDDGPASQLFGDIVAANPEQKAELSAMREAIREELRAQADD